MNILKVILWPVDRTKELRYVNFELGKVNVIRGDSRTGKSALISIIDYVLGANKCKIPVGPIRNTVDWFGLLLDNGSSEILLARKSPGIGNSKSAIYYKTEKKIDIPRVIEKENMNLEIMKQLFNDIFNYSNLELKEGAGFANRPSFRDSVSLNFQPQTIIASPNVLYFKADSNEHREKLKNFLPYILDILTNQNILDFHEIEMLEKENRKLSKLVMDQEEYLKGYDRRLEDLIAEAISLGMIDDSSLTQLNNTNDRLIVVKKAYESTRITFSNDSLGKYNELIEKKENIFRELHDDILKLNNQCKSIQQQIDYYSETKFLNEEAIHERISLADWLLLRINSFAELDTVSINNIKNTIDKYKNLHCEIVQAMSVMRNELIDKKLTLQNKQNEFNSIKIELQNLYEFNKNSENKKLYEKIAEFKGKLYYEINYFNTIKNDDIKTQIANNDSKLRILKSQTNFEKIRQKQEVVLNTLTDNIRLYLKGLDIDDCFSPVRLELKELTISREKKETQDYQSKEYLWEIGSASNWISYHISVF